MRFFFVVLLMGLNLSIFSQAKIVKPPFNPQIAVKFVNDYITVLDGRRINTQNWIKSNPLLTSKFKTEYKKSLNGYFNPIFDAQDYPDKGFKVMKADSVSGYVILQGVDWKEFLLTVRLVLQDNKWLLDGSGVINISENKRSKR